MNINELINNKAIITKLANNNNKTPFNINRSRISVMK